MDQTRTRNNISFTLFVPKLAPSILGLVQSGERVEQKSTKYEGGYFIEEQEHPSRGRLILERALVNPQPSIMHVPLYLVVSSHPCKLRGSCIPKGQINQSSRCARLRMAITESAIAFCTIHSYGLSDEAVRVFPLFSQTHPLLRSLWSSRRLTQLALMRA